MIQIKSYWLKGTVSDTVIYISPAILEQNYAIIVFLTKVLSSFTHLSDSKVYERGFSFFSFHRASSETPETLTTLKRTPGISPFAFPFLPNPASRTSSFSSTKFKQPSLGTKAVTFFPFLINWTRTHFRIAELGCLASTPTFSRTIPLAWEEPPKGDDLNAVPRRRFLKDKSAHRLESR